MATGLCLCGCGGKTNLATTSDKRYGTTKGQPTRFIRGHYGHWKTLGEDGTKRCPSCNVFKAATPEFFVSNKARPHGLDPYCKPCMSRKSVLFKQEARRDNPYRVRRAERIQMRRLRALNPDRYRSIRKRANLKLKLEMIAAYGGKCTCCGITDPMFLTLEHIKRDGGAHRKSLGTGGGQCIWRDLKKRGWPQDGFTVYCWNCNMATRFGQPCPHQRLRAIKC